MRRSAASVCVGSGLFVLSAGISRFSRRAGHMQQRRSQRPADGDRQRGLIAADRHRNQSVDLLAAIDVQITIALQQAGGQ